MLKVIGAVLFVASCLIAGMPALPPVESDGWGGIVNLSDDATQQYMGYGYQHTVATDTGGNVHIVWYDNRTGTNQVFYRKWTRSTGTWGPVVQVTNQSAPAYRPAVACDYSGNVHIVWYHSTASYYGIWYRKWDVSTGNWGESLYLYNPGGNYLNYYPSIACRPGGNNVHVVWYGRNSANPTYFRTMHIEYIPGTGWGSVTIVDTTPTESCEVASVAVDRGDSVYVVWRQKVSGYYQVFYRWRNGSGVWRNVERVSDVNPNASMFACAVGVDSAGSKVGVVWNGDIPGNSNDRVFYRERTASGWGPTEIISTYGDGSQYDPVVVVGNDNRIDVIWRGYTEISSARQEMLYRAKLGNTWGDVMQLTNRSAGGSVLSPVIARGLFDDLHISWYDNSDGDNEVYYLRGNLVDGGVVAIVSPSGRVVPGTTVSPRATWRNYRPYNLVDFRAFCFLISPGGSRVYTESLTVTDLSPGAETTLVFPDFVVNEMGSWTVRCSTAAVLDMNPANDVQEAEFVVAVNSTNIEMFQIQAPAGTIDSGTTVIPRARWWNRGNEAADFTAYCQLIDPNGSVVYLESLLVVNFAGHNDTTLSFPSYLMQTPGEWQVRCSTFCASDTFPDDDVQTAGFVVRTIPRWPYGWHEVKQVPLAPSGRTVSDGGWITQMKIGGVRYLFVLKGNRVGDFYLYNPVADTWHQLKPMPLGTEMRPPRRASVGVAGGDYIYATKGNNTLGFWRYHIDNDSWEQIKDVPAGTSGKRVKAGADMVYVKRPHTDTGYVYLLKGYTDEFYRFNTVSGEWETRAPAPLTATGRKWDRGSWIVYQARPGQNQFYIYAHKAKVHELWKYDVLADTWFSQPLRGMPFIGKMGKAKKCKDGSAGAWYNDAIYALKGGNTCEFWRYDALADSWVELDTMPSVGSTGRKKRVKGGGDIVLYEDGVFFALKGNKTPECWCYVEADTFTTDSRERQGVAGKVSSLLPGSFVVAPSVLGANRVLTVAGGKGAMTVEVFDIIGRRVFNQKAVAGSGVFNLERLQSGVYILRVDDGERCALYKLVIE